MTARAATIPVLPVLTARTLLGGAASKLPSVAQLGRPAFVLSGEAAIYGALLLGAVNPGDDVLVPAFHCPSMVNPIRQRGARPVYYGINEDLTLNERDIESRLTSRTRALIAPHLFGRIQRLARLRELCDGARITLIEDCAHAFFGTIGGVPIGSTGHFAIASPRKFFPLAEGGVLTSAADVDREPPLQRPSAARSIRVAFDTLDLAVQAKRLPLLAPLIGGVKALRRRTPHAEPSTAPASVGATRVPAATGVTRLLCHLASTEYAMQRRQRNFQRLRDALRATAGVRVLETESTDVARTVPYMLPILLSAPQQQFARLKASATPIWRWEYSQMGVCKTTDWLAQAMIQLPCHQSLRERDLDVLLRNVADAVTASPDIQRR